ncbi:ribosome biogenesis GTPase YlqF [Fructilactobacillus sanfranciscensis]|uniref:ribosome biogenesis GTPase YlqF n=1 Tax=Fructilactobacillus sanfranciscensis TaxID=1625 RepID=UPI0012EC1C13|nr:ribosome biogenesis GTPase YlqF [Fructilactobacillus sanfranciscensis]MDN4461845.1 ribosome biogenesis GTPase YlqF [Fructilactobacillus sanfranciscensis]MVF15012.1 ribosome biogenesis GTPase YlqF [Fructilactobacillus sanfranciscensis]NDR61228.1 ribosome biogenesis GTPase YlqF [Fructilactobacillus sanfranciscensis]
MKSNIQWFPGHMAKAIRQFEENIKLVDIVFELVDARIPYTSINPEVKRISRDKPRLMILTKADLADPVMTKKWIEYFKSQGIRAIAIDSKVNGVRKKIENISEGILKDYLESQSNKGYDRKALKAICVGVPNVGKSTLLNQLVSKRSAQVGNRPGVTKGQQWLTSNGKLVLLDTPGILWPKFQSQEIAEKLSLTGAIRESSFHSDDVALFALDFFKQNHREELKNRYHLTDVDFELSNPDLLLKITANLGMRDDYERASDRIINDVRKGKLGRYTLDFPDKISVGEE